LNAKSPKSWTRLSIAQDPQNRLGNRENIMLFRRRSNALTVIENEHDIAIIPHLEGIPDDSAEQVYLDLKVSLHQQLFDVINLAQIERMPREQFYSEIGDIIRELLVKETTPLNAHEKKQIVDDVLDELLGLGPLEPLLKDPTVNDILVNGFDKVFVERV